MQFDMNAVKSACKGLSPAYMRAAVPVDGQDAPPPRLSYVDEDPNPGLALLYAGKTKYKVSYTTTETVDGDWVGWVKWSLLGIAGNFPAVTDYMDTPIPSSATPTYFPNEALAKNCAATCADIIRKQMVELFHTNTP